MTSGGNGAGAETSERETARASLRAEQAASNCDHSAAGALDERDLEAAFARLDRFSLVVPTERLKDAMPLFASLFGWNPRSYVRAGTHSSKESHKGDYEAEAIARIETTGDLHRAYLAATALDRRLYARAVARFDAQLASLPGAAANASLTTPPDGAR